MRPLVVLLLVLGSLAALLVALMTLSDSSRHGDEPRGVIVAPAAPHAQPSADLQEPRVAVEQRAEGPEGEPSRKPVQPARDPMGPKVAFGAIHGKVLDDQGDPVSGALVNLFDTKPSTLGDDYFLLSGNERPRPTAKFETKADGQFRFDQLDPRKDWSLEVSHERFEFWASQVAIPVPEGGVYPETIIMNPGQIMSGVVRSSATGRPVEGVLLVADNPFALARPKNKRAQGRLEAKTDANGAYVFPNLGASPGQNRILTLTAPGYATQVHNNFMMVDYSQTSNRIKNSKQEQPHRISRTKDFELEPGRSIAGRVIGPDHNGKSGVELEAMNQTGTVGSTGTTLSGKNGEFLIDGLAEGIYTLRVTAPNYDAAPLQRVETGSTNVVIELFELASATGKVIDAEGRPLANFVVKARASNEINDAYGAVMAQRAVKGSSDGSFELTGIPEGSYVMEAQAEGYASCFSEPFTATQGLVASDLVVRMTRGGSLSGQVLDAYAKAPIAGAEISTVENDWIDGDLWDLFGALEPSAMTKAKVFADDKGRFTVDVMTPGTYQVQIRARGYSPLFVKDIEVVEGQNTEMPVQVLGKGASIDGIVYGRDTAIVSGSIVQVTPTDLADPGHARQTRSDGTGRFTVENLQPGTYDITAQRPSGGAANPFEALADINQSQITLSVDDGAHYEIELHLGPKRGTR